MQIYITIKIGFPVYQWLSNFIMPQNHLEGLLKQIAGSIPEFLM